MQDNAIIPSSTRATLKNHITSFVQGYSTEITPTDLDGVERLSEFLPPGTSVYITFLPNSHFQSTIRTAHMLRGRGFNPVPHLAARSFSSADELREGIARLVGEAGVTDVLAIAGAVRSPRGPFASSLDILRTGYLNQNGIEHIGVAGHPEGSPDIGDHELRAALEWKNLFSASTDAKMFIVTQVCFQAGPIIKWLHQIRSWGIRLPVRIGVPGVARIKNLLHYAKVCGVGPSVEFLRNQGIGIARLLTTATPDLLIQAVALNALRDPGLGIDGCHVFAFGGVKASAEWLAKVGNEEFELRSDGRGFAVSKGVERAGRSREVLDG